MANLKLTSVLSASLINEGRVSFTRNYGKLNTETPVTNAAIGMTQSADQAIFPTIGVQGLFSIGGQSNDQFRTAVNSWQFGDQISWTHGRHNIRGGAQFERIQDNFNLPGVKRGSLFFLSFADFLLGESGDQNGSGYSNVYQSTSQAGITDRAFRVSNFSGFVQDDFKLNSHLTVNAGLRWEVFGGLREDQGKLVNFWPSLADNDFSNGPNYSGYIVSSNFPGNPPAGVTPQQQFNVLHACDALAQLRSASGLGLAAPAEEQQNRGAGRLRPVLLAYYRQ